MIELSKISGPSSKFCMWLIVTFSLRKLSKSNCFSIINQVGFPQEIEVEFNLLYENDA